MRAKQRGVRASMLKQKEEPQRRTEVHTIKSILRTTKAKKGKKTSFGRGCFVSERPLNTTRWPAIWSARASLPFPRPAKESRECDRKGGKQATDRGGGKDGRAIEEGAMRE